ncbi:unnamed protein product [Phaeothamnion confervicola]
MAGCGGQGGGAAARPFRWCVAGRSRARLASEVTDRLAALGLPMPDEIVEVDNFDDSGLRRLLSRARLCLSCAGPYRFLGEPVVHACVDSGTDYADICGEPEFFDRMRLKYHDTAAAAGVLVLHACAFDSVPADLGALWTAQAFLAPPPASCPAGSGSGGPNGGTSGSGGGGSGGGGGAGGGGICSSVESYICVSAGPAGAAGHYATYASAVHGFGAAQQLRALRAELRQRFLSPEVPRVGPRPPGGVFHGDGGASFVTGHAFKFPGADSSVVRSTQASLAARLGPAPAAAGGALGLCPHFGAYFTLPGAWQAVQMAVFGGVFQALARHEWGRSLLLKYPGAFTNGVFTHEGPTEQQLVDTSFTMTFVARGYSPSAAVAAIAAAGAAGKGSASLSESTSETEPLSGAATGRSPALPPLPPDRTIITQMRGPEPGYVATPAIFLAVARCLLAERPALGELGGCFTPGAVLVASARLRAWLEEEGVHFDVLSDRVVSASVAAVRSAAV